MMMWEKVVLEREARCRIAKRGTVQVTWATSNNNTIVMELKSDLHTLTHV